MNIPRREDAGLFSVGGVPVDGGELFAHLLTDLLVAGSYLLLMFMIVFLNHRKYVTIYVPRVTYLVVFALVFLMTFGSSIASLTLPGLDLHLAYKGFVAAILMAIVVAIVVVLPREIDPLEKHRLQVQNVRLEEAVQAKRLMENRVAQARSDAERTIKTRTHDLSRQVLGLEKQLIEERLGLERMTESKRRMDELILRTNTAVVYLDKQGHLLECNLALAQILGRADVDELQGRDFARLLGLTQSDGLLHFVNEVIRRGSMTYEMDVQPPARGNGAIELHGAVAVYEGQPCAMALIRDTSDRRAAELKLLESREALTAALEVTRKANATRSDFLAKMNHELRTPLNGIIGLSEIVRFKSQSKNFTPAESAKLAANIHQSGKHLLSVVDDLLDLSRLEAGTRELSPVSVVVRLEIETALVTLGSIADRRRISVRNRCPEDFEWTVDQRALKQIVINLVNNAIKFSPPGSTVDVSLTHTDDAMSLHVQDEGPGVSIEDQEKILTPFGRSEYAETHKIDGVGLGLAIVAELLKLQGGHVEIQSVPRKGSTFTAVFPLATRPNNGVPAATVQ